MKDPLIYGTEEERRVYGQSIMDKVQEQIRDDRQRRAAQPDKTESPPVIIGGAGMANGLNNAL